MSSQLKIAIGFLAALLLSAIFWSFYSYEPKTDWRKGYRSFKKAPFDTYIIYNELENLFPEDSIVTLYESVYNFFDDKYDYDNERYTISGNYIFINDETRTLGYSSVDELLNFTYSGNNVFLATNTFPKSLKDSLKFSTNSISYLSEVLEDAKDFFLAKNHSSYTFNDKTDDSYFSVIDSTTTEILGTEIIDSLQNKAANFIRVPHGQGYFYLHSQPIVFTNYHLLKEGQEHYIADVFAHLPNGTLFWDTHTVFESDNNDNDNSTFFPLQYILSQESLKWAFYLTIIGLLFFIAFNTKRKQRIIKIRKPLPNATVDFTKTIGHLYYLEGNHKSIADKKIKYFLERIRNRYLLDTQNLNSDFIKKLHLKSGKKEGQIKLLIDYIIKIDKAYECSEFDLVRLNELIEKFLNTD